MKNALNLLLIVLLFNIAGAQKKRLALNLVPGETYFQVSNAKMTINQDIEGQAFNSTVIIGGKMSYKVVNINKDDYDMSVQFESLSMKMELPEGIIEFNSNSNKEDIFSLLLSKFIDNPFEIKMSKYGKVTEIKKIESIIDSLFDDFDDIPENQLNQLKDQLKKTYGAKAGKGSREMITAIFPNKSVNIGDKWTVNTSLETSGSSLITSEYKLENINSDYISIIGNSTIESADNKGFTVVNGMHMKQELDGTMYSSIKIDPKTGWIIEAKITQELKGNNIFKETSELPNGMIIPVKMKNEMIFTNN